MMDMASSSDGATEDAEMPDTGPTDDCNV